MTVDCFGFSVGWFGGVGPVSCRLRQILPQQVSEFLAAVLGKRVFKALGSAASVWQLPDSGGVRYTVGTLEPSSVVKAAEPGAAKPDTGKATGLSMPFPTDATINQLD